MNWKDKELTNVDKKLLVSNDLLQILFDRQQKLMNLYKMSVNNIDTKNGQNTIRACTMHLVEELCEILHCLKNKPWVDYETIVDKDAMLDEVADAAHFFVELMILLGLNPTTLTELYIKKNYINLDRIKSNY